MDRKLKLQCPHLLTPECLEEDCAVPEQADVLSGIPVPHPKWTATVASGGCNFHPIIYTSPHQHKRVWWRDVVYTNRWPLEVKESTS